MIIKCGGTYPVSVTSNGGLSISGGERGGRKSKILANGLFFGGEGLIQKNNTLRDGFG